VEGWRPPWNGTTFGNKQQEQQQVQQPERFIPVLLELDGSFRSYLHMPKAPQAPINFNKIVVVSKGWIRLNDGGSRCC